MAELLIYRGTVLDRTVALPRDQVLSLGRGSQNHIDLPDPGKAVSRTHARIEYGEDHFLIVDAGSENGLWVGGQRVPQAVLGPTEAVVVGPYRLLLEIDDEQQTVYRPLPQSERPPGKAGGAGIPALLARFGAASRPVRYGAVLGAVVTLAVVAVLAAVLMRRGADLGPSPPAAVQSPPESVRPPSVRPSPPPVSPEDEALSSKQSAEAQAQPATIQADAPGSRPEATTEVRQARRAPAPGPSFSVARRAGERESEYRARARALQAQYERARSQFEGEDAAGALATLEALLGEEPGQPDAQELLARARDLDAARKKADLQAAFDAAATLEAAGRLREAEEQYAALRGMVAAPAGVDEAVSRVRGRRIELGNQALANAKQFHSIGSRLADAAREYERAVYLLPDDHPNHAVARERLAAIRRYYTGAHFG